MITIVKRPERFTPAGNPVIYQITSNNPNIVLFRAELFDVESGTVINQMDVFPTPATPNGSYLNLSQLLSNVVRWEINNDSFLLVTPIFKTIRSYRLKLTERILNSTTGIIEDGQAYDNPDEINYIFNAELGRVGFNNYLQIKYAINKGSVASFLTTKPNHVKVNDLSVEQLYFMHDGSVDFLMLRINFFNESGEIIDMVTKQIENLDEYQMYRLNVSPKSLKDSSNINFDDVAYYTVQIQDNLGQPKTVERVYKYEEVECWREFVNVLWVNVLGGIDSYQFNHPVDTINLTKFQIKKSVYDINENGIYSDNSGGIYNPSDVIISNKPVTTTKVTSKELSDLEAFWLVDLYRSKQVFIELPDLSLVPVILPATSYTIPRLKLSKGTLNTITVELQLTEGIIPTGVQAYANNKSSIEFIDRQMNTIVKTSSGYGLTQEESRNRNYSDGYGHEYS